MIDLTVNFDYGIDLTWILLDSFINWPYEEPLFNVLTSPTRSPELNSAQETSGFTEPQTFTSSDQLIGFTLSIARILDRTMRFGDTTSKRS
jgi:hypothetical protein